MPESATPTASRWQNFWFRPVSAAGFGMMRVAFGAVTFFTMAVQWPAMDRYYGPEGILPHAMLHSMTRAWWRFSLVDYVSPAISQWLYLLMLAALLLVMIGVWTRAALLLSLVLLFSFHEYGSIALDGGDTMLRLIGFILLLSPCDRTFSVSNLLRRFRMATATGMDQSPSQRTMPIWPYRLLLWQMIVIYVSSAVLKLSGGTWLHGEAVAIVLHHDMFRRVTLETADLLSRASPLLSYFTLVTQLAWALILPMGLLSCCRLIRTERVDTFKRALLLCGILLHGGIALFLDVGTFSFVVFTSYLGLLVDNDFRALRGYINRPPAENLVILFDGRCGFCNRTIIVLRSLDWLHRLQFVNFHDPDNRKRSAPDVDFAVLNEEMHVRKPDGTYRKGYYAFRVILGELPLTWFFQPVLFFPGVAPVGEKIYRYVAAHR